MRAHIGKTTRDRQGLAPTSRTEAFSDGVFAIAITILVLKIHVPSARQISNNGSLLGALLTYWPAYLSYLTAFLTIGNLWLSHHALFERIGRVDRTTQWLNLLLLLFVSFIPFPNALVADALLHGTDSTAAKTATALYALAALACVGPWALLWRHLARHPALLADVTGNQDRARVPRSMVGAAAYVVCFVVALWSPLIAVVLLVGTAVFFAATIND